MQIQFIALALALPAGFVPAAAPFQGVGPSTTGAVDSKTSIFGEPLYVNGRRVSDDEIKLALIYGPCRAVLDLSKVGMIIEDEINRQCEEKAEAELVAQEQDAGDKADAVVAAADKEKPFATKEIVEKAEKEVAQLEKASTFETPDMLSGAEQAIAEQEKSKPFGTPAERATAKAKLVQASVSKARDAAKAAIVARETAPARKKVWDPAYEKAKPFKDAAARVEARKAALARLSSLLHEKYRVRDEDFEAEYQYTVEDFKKSYPVLDIAAEICRAFRSVDWYSEQLRQTMYFDRVFLPTNPAEWPPTTVEAIRADESGGALMLPDAQQSYEQRLKAAERNDGKLPREDALLMTFQREMVRNAMFNLMTFKTHPDGIDPKLALWGDANGDGKPEVAITIDEFWNKVQETVTETEIYEAKQWYVASLAVRDRLAKDGALLSDEEGKKALGELTLGFEDNLVTLEQMATKTNYFPSVEAFVEYYEMREGYHRMIAPKLEPGPGGELSPVLREYFDRANRVMGLGMIDCEVLLVSAMDIGRFRWKKDGWSWAKKTAQDLRAQIEQNQKDYNEQRAKASEAQAQGKEWKPEKPVPEPYRFWSQLLDDHSEYWDPPPPEQHDGNQPKQSDVSYKKKGRFGPRYRNDLVSYVGETPYNEWVSGQCITDLMFFDQAENTVAGPFSGPLGWYITRLNRRTPPSRPLNLAEPRHVQLLHEDYLRWSFNQYTKDAVAHAEIKGWKPR